jgi:hypothetical protein
VLKKGEKVQEHRFRTGGESAACARTGRTRMMPGAAAWTSTLLQTCKQRRQRHSVDVWQLIDPCMPCSAGLSFYKVQDYRFWTACTRISSYFLGAILRSPCVVMANSFRLQLLISNSSMQFCTHWQAFSCPARHTRSGGSTQLALYLGKVIAGRCPAATGYSLEGVEQLPAVQRDMLVHRGQNS